MGTCFSSDCSGEKASPAGKQEGDENTVYVGLDDELSPGAKGRRIASLYSLQGKKGLNQDAAILCKGYGDEDGLFCGVFDGHGRNGHFISKFVRDYLPSLTLGERNSLQQANEGSSSNTSSVSSSSSSTEMLDEWNEACVNAFRAMDQELVLKLELDCTYSGTTAVSIIKQGKDLVIANLGDSRAVLAAVSEDGRRLEALQLTTDLKPSVPQEAERIRKSNGRVFALKSEPHIQRVWLPDENYPGLAMARAFGDFHLKKYGVISVPEVSRYNLTHRDLFVVLATDGVWDVLTNEEVVSAVWSSSSHEESSRRLVEVARRRWKSKFPSAKVDDCTAACVFFQERREGLLLPQTL
ncbi:probable protein phosphatase 2C 12 [Zingiber officinale]|uniref:probable protein phosphatase 2C 12 n=1 Tax=Zingiber officinale TaxID=94328 RepID=UPI001C4D0461|nr:probable protein phosphatase 2C 12 [Zingiber officinale]